MLACTEAKSVESRRVNAKSVVFVIDDDRDIREGLRALLESVSLDCEAFSSTGDFLQHKRPDAVSCLVLDVRLPGLSGLDFQQELARTRVGIPIVFLTGHGDIPMSVRAIKGGAVEFLTKPVREQDLLDAIRTALECDRARREREESLQEIKARVLSLSDCERKVMVCFVTAGMLNKQIAGAMSSQRGPSRCTGTTSFSRKASPSERFRSGQNRRVVRRRPMCQSPGIAYPVRVATIPPGHQRTPLIRADREGDSFA